MDVQIDLIIFDVDGTLRYTVGHDDRPPFSQDEWRLLPNTVEKIASIRVSNPKMEWGFATNQASVGRGFLNNAQCRALLASLWVRLFGFTASTQAIQVCYHKPQVWCSCRKPHPALLNRLMLYRGVPPIRTLFVGDAESDGLAAKRAGCHFAWADAWFDRESYQLASILNAPSA